MKLLTILWFSFTSLSVWDETAWKLLDEFDSALVDKWIINLLHLDIDKRWNEQKKHVNKFVLSNYLGDTVRPFFHYRVPGHLDCTQFCSIISGISATSTITVASAKRCDILLLLFIIQDLQIQQCSCLWILHGTDSNTVSEIQLFPTETDQVLKGIWEIYPYSLLPSCLYFYNVLYFSVSQASLSHEHDATSSSLCWEGKGAGLKFQMREDCAFVL